MSPRPGWVWFRDGISLLELLSCFKIDLSPDVLETREVFLPRIFLALLALTFLVGCSEKNDDPEKSPSGETPADPKPLPRGPAHPLPANVYSFQISRGAGLGELSMGKVGSSAPRDAWKRYVHIRMEFDYPFPCNGIEVLRNGEPAFQSSTLGYQVARGKNMTGIPSISSAIWVLLPSPGKTS